MLPNLKITHQPQKPLVGSLCYHNLCLRYILQYCYVLFCSNTDRSL